MKRFTKAGLSLVLALSMTSVFTGCSAKSTATTSSDAASKKVITIGLCFPSADHGWLGAVIQDAQDEAKAEGIKFVVTTADNPNKQANDVDDLITKKVDVIIMDPIESAALTTSADKIKAANIPLVVFDREIENDSFTALVKGDNKGVGINAGKYIGAELQGKGNVVVIEGVPCSVTTLRSDGFKEALKSYPNIKVVATQSGDFQKEKSLNVMQNILQSQKKIDAVYTEDDEMALGVIQAIKEAKRTDIKVVTGCGGDKDAYKLLKDSDPLFKATFLYSPLMVKDAVKLGIQIANGTKPADKTKVIEATQVTKDNVAKFYDEKASY